MIQRMFSGLRQCLFWQLAVLHALSLTVAAAPDLILHNGKIVTVDASFSIHQAMAVEGGRITAVGINADVLRLKGAATHVLDLNGRTVLPGLIDSHVHPAAAMTEYDHPIPDMETIADVLAYVRERARVVKEGEWIVLQQIFITRLREQRYPTRQELDAAAPGHPVIFRTGPDAALNSLALQKAGIDKNHRIPEGVPGKVETDGTGEPTGILRGYGNFTKLSLSSGRSPKPDETRQRTLELFRDYNAVGLTTVSDRNASAGSIDMYRKMRDAGDMPVRMRVMHGLSTTGTLEEIRGRIQGIAGHPLRKPDSMLQIIGVKVFLDGGMLTGSAYMREPWGVSSIYGIDDPAYRGVLNIPKERLLPIVQATVEAGLQFTAHSVGDGAVHTLLDVYEEVNRQTPVRATRPCFTHSNFMSEDSVSRAAKIGCVHDIQPAWLYLDSRTLQDQFGYDRMRWFQPLKSIFAAGGMAGGGSDHMQKIGSLRSINPYNPFLGMWVAVTRKARWYEGRVHPEEALTREQAIQFYTRNNAWMLFMEKDTGSLEPGKWADFILIDRDVLTCPEDDIKDVQVLKTWLAGRMVFERVNNAGQ